MSKEEYKLYISQCHTIIDNEQELEAIYKHVIECFTKTDIGQVLVAEVA